jgi:hypothetical protein
MLRTLFHAKSALLSAAVVGVGVVGMTYSFAAANTVPAAKVGDGSGAITGYTISAEVYTLNGTDPTKIDEVAFTLNSVPPAGSVIKIRLVSASADWYTCNFVAADVTCDTTTPQATAATANELRVVIAQ